MEIVFSYFKLIVLVAALLLSKAAYGQHVDSRVYTFGVVPQQASEKLASLWIPFIQHLSKQTGLNIEFATAPSIPEFEERLAEGVYDFAYMNPYHFTVFNEHPGYIAISRQKNHEIRGIIVVSSGLEIESLEELAGKELAFPAPNAFAATLITRAFLDKAAPGYTATFVNSHDSVYQSVAKGFFAAGGGIVRTLNEVSPELQRELEVLWLSPGYTGHAFAAHPAVPESVRTLVQGGLIMMSSSEEGAFLIGSLGMEGLQAAIDSDWDDVRALGLK
ncbi:phosphate/phosphite/phosphonate ABC transporter substrate-binding protein [Marinobacter hydrocarbonoclasticus]|uniref:phosphate/phosphite/phosphonate ABC transporter substrate-binding protein n=1 Tax=Marinobacter nauticus TaxID=2743 RepID=UPI001C98C210|nr:phosphate/phosphite/phosphonate ABC transporter substrate-binding protein [Marinobacter nauticus]MBY6194599.1 phosphate/phosphite/phosphonate ABC transporter substrate-binding protein [Marinobacter nauticus]MBY6215747.1 phosphate/phosphite/phosphonate ABC transporter substrate-binding protein [Marinobacter nauticus]